MRKYLLLTAAFIWVNTLLAQQTTVVTQKLKGRISLFYHVLTNDPAIRSGLFQVRYNKRTALASGLYANNKKIGIWHFFDMHGHLIQNFNFTTNTLTYEAPEDSAHTFHYRFDKTVDSTDVLTKPIRIGGRCWGYLPYFIDLKKPPDYDNTGETPMSLMAELLVSPGGRLADLTIHVTSVYGTDHFKVNLNLIADEDKIFIPATVNKTPVSCRIFINYHYNAHNLPVFD